MRNVAVCKDDSGDVLSATDPLEGFLRLDGYPARVAGPGESGRVAALVDARDLRGGECDYPNAGIVAVAHVEVVKVPACGTENYDPGHRKQAFLHTCIGRVAPLPEEMDAVGYFPLPGER
jgi:hypothetical protein